MPLGTISPSPKFTGLADDGSPLVLGKLYTYVARTTTPLVTYQDVGLTIPNSNPIILDSGGRCTIFLPQATVKFILKDANDVTVWTQDDIASTSIGESAGVGQVFVFAGDPTSPVTAAAYPVGSTVDKTVAGTSILYADSVNLLGQYTIEAMLMAAGGGTVTVGIFDLDDGDPDTPLATAQSSSTTGELVQSGPIAFAAAGLSKRYGIKAKVDTGSGFVWGVRLVQTGGGASDVPASSPLALSTIPLGGDPVNGFGFQANGTYYWTGGLAALINWDAIPAAYGVRAHIWSRVGTAGGSMASDIYNQTDAGVAAGPATAVTATSFQADGSEQVVPLPRLTGTKYYRGRSTLTSCTDKDALAYGFFEVYLP